MFVVEDLQLHEAGDYEPEKDYPEYARDDDARDEDAALRMVVLDRG